MGQITYQELFKDEQMRFAMSLINSAYASDSLDRLGIQKPGSVHYYLPMEIQYLLIPMPVDPWKRPSGMQPQR
jgi:hypothetical protein